MKLTKKRTLQIAESWGFLEEVKADLKWQAQNNILGLVSLKQALEEWDLPLMTKEEWQKKEGKD